MKKTNSEIGDQKIGRIIIFMIALSAFFLGGMAVRAEAAATTTITTTTVSNTVTAGNSTSYAIRINRSGYTGKIALSVPDVPVGVTLVFSPNSTIGTSTTLTVTTAPSLAPGNYKLKIHALEITTGQNTTPLLLTLRVNPNVRLSVAPTSRSILAGGVVRYQITLNRLSFNGPVTLTALNLPAGATARFFEGVTNNSFQLQVQTTVEMGNSLTDFTVTGAPGNASVAPLSLRLRTNCDIQWVEQFGTRAKTIAYNVTTDRFGNAIVVGSTYDFLENSLVETRESAFISKYYADGTLAWTRLLDAPGELDYKDQARTVVTDSSGNIYVAGTTEGMLDHTLPDPGVNANIPHWWLAKYDNNGLLHWIRQDPTGRDSPDIKLGWDNSQNLNLHALDAFGEMQKAVCTTNGHLLGQTFANLNLNNHRLVNFQVAGNFYYSVGSRTPPNNAPEIGVVRKYNLNGTLFWEQTFQIDSLPTFATQIAVDPAGNVFVGGDSEVEWNHKQRWIRKFDAAGNLLWDKRLPRFSGVDGIIFHPDGNLLVFGQGERFLWKSETSWLLKFDPATGRELWFREFTTDHWEFGNVPYDIQADGAGNIYVVGSGWDFAPANQNPGDQEAFVFKYREPSSTGLPGNIVPGQTSAARGTFVSVTGANISGAEEVLIDGYAVSFTVVSGSEIRVLIPDIHYLVGSRYIRVRSGCNTVRNEVPLLIH